jgi:hypothetical protein
MKPQQSISGRLILPLALPVLATLVGLQSACTSLDARASTPAVPASQGTVKASKGDNGNTVPAQRRFKLLVTPEFGGRCAQPPHAPVFTAEVDRPE